METISSSLDKLNEECAVFGVSLKHDGAAGLTYNGLLALQHRGQESAGIAILAGHSIEIHKNFGLVGDVFSDKMLERLSVSNMAIGHARYSAGEGKNKFQNIQPFVSEFLTGRLAAAHNGSLTNADEIRKKLSSHGLDFQANSDSEVISSLVAYNTTQCGNIKDGVVKAFKELNGAFSTIILSSEDKLIAVRDRHGFRPLCLGVHESGIIAASESCAVESCGFKFLRDVEPGEVVIIENGEIKESIKFAESKKQSSCIFEYVYFARPDSVIDGLSVYEARYKMGQQLAREFPADADAVCGVPDSGLEAAMGYANFSGLPLVSGFVKNRYMGRSFIYPVQSAREFAVKIKLNPLRATVEGKRIVLVDDSIVRGTTCARIISALRDAGAKEIHLRISSPPFRHTCHYGTDIGSEENLIANKLSIAQICEKIGADSLGYISIDGLKKACDKCKLGFCTNCFSKSE